MLLTLRKDNISYENKCSIRFFMCSIFFPTINFLCLCIKKDGRDSQVDAFIVTKAGLPGDGEKQGRSRLGNGGERGCSRASPIWLLFVFK